MYSVGVGAMPVLEGHKECATDSIATLLLRPRLDEAGVVCQCCHVLQRAVTAHPDTECPQTLANTFILQIPAPNALLNSDLHTWLSFLLRWLRLVAGLELVPEQFHETLHSAIPRSRVFEVGAAIVLGWLAVL